MVRALDWLSVLLLLLAIGAFGLGVHALGRRADLDALYWLVIGALVLKGATDLLRPQGGR
ncbi:MAG: hypothetical protein KIT72_05285 [Polyangiaceae bacterium]|nr:hypothetical protein [Polyangiaceae bacterium]MCW5789811.1 hypothetical protein [Polyangiaceae bacterium]